MIRKALAHVSLMRVRHHHKQIVHRVGGEADGAYALRPTHCCAALDDQHILVTVGCHEDLRTGQDHLVWVARCGEGGELPRRGVQVENATWIRVLARPLRRDEQMPRAPG